MGSRTALVPMDAEAEVSDELERVPTGSLTYPSLAAAGMALSRELAGKPSEHRDFAKAAGRAEAAYKSARAGRRLLAKRSGEAKTDRDASDIADTDEDVVALFVEWTDAVAVADACKESIYALGRRLSFGQSLISTERETDRAHSQWGGT